MMAESAEDDRENTMKVLRSASRELTNEHD